MSSECFATLLFSAMKQITFIIATITSVCFLTLMSSKVFSQTSALTPGISTYLTFNSGKQQERGRQNLTLRFAKTGKYSLTFSNANRTMSDHWLIWDCILLKKNKSTIWSIGQDEAPPNYSKAAFDEFCQSGDCQTTFVVGKSSSRQFSKEINDYSIPSARVDFTVDASQVNTDLTLVLSTLYATHSWVDQYRMEVSLEQR